ncbi:MAG: hypothetical protein U9R32_05545 [Bacteroidota bacterium]|nr:hypothetical protein [Bacteroidota bacterium]
MKRAILKTISESVYNRNYSFCPEVEGASGYKNSNININSLSRVYNINISVKPNPAKEWAAFNHTLPEKVTTATITITDVTGKPVEVLNIAEQQGQKLWDTRKFKSGRLYLLNKSKRSKCNRQGC